MSKKEIAVQDKEFANQLAALTQTQAADTGDVAFMRFSKGEWLYGAEEVEPTEGSLWAVNLKTFAHGYIVWDNGEVVDEVMTPLGTPQTAIPVEHIQASKEDKEYNANPQVAFQMLCIKGDEAGTVVAFSSSSVGGRKAVAKLLKAVTKEATAGNPYVAIVELVVDSYKHNTYGKVFTPVFEISEFITEADLADYGTEASEPADDEDEGDADTQTDIEDVIEEEAAPQRKRRRR